LSLIERVVKKILLIEDSAATKILLLSFLEAKGYCAISAEDGLIGIQQAGEHSPDLIISDIMMARLDGYGVLTALRENPATATIPLIFLSAKVTQSDIRTGMELGADDYLTKPCKLEELLRAIAAQLKKQADQRQGFVLECQRILKLPTSETGKKEDSQSFFPTCPKLKEVFNFIEENYHQAISLSDVAKSVGYSPAYLTDLVKRQTGETVQRWIIKRRMAAACSLLLNTDQSVNQIAEAVGYSDKNYFFYQFRQHHETTPQMWRKQKPKNF